MGQVTETLHRKLTDALTPVTLDIIDESEQHRGHAGYREGGESHFHVDIVADAFAGLSRIARQRLVMSALREELAGPVHALTISAKTPGESG